MKLESSAASPGRPKWQPLKPAVVASAAGVLTTRSLLMRLGLLTETWSSVVVPHLLHGCRLPRGRKGKLPGQLQATHHFCP